MRQARAVETARAAVATAPLRTELQTFPLPEVGPDDGLMAVEACGLCGTDWEFYTRRRGSHLGPLILGHEMVGRVLAAGERARERWRIGEGDRVAVEEFLPCGECEFCLSGRPALCAATDSRSQDPFLRYGATPTDVPPGLWGGFSEVLYLHPRALVHRLDDLPADVATLFVPISNGVRWVRTDGGLRPGGTVVVQGPGAHGLGCVIAAREAGAGRVIVVGRTAGARLNAACALGALTVAGAHMDVVSAVRDLTGGEMADVVIDLAPGATETVEAAIAMTRKGGTIVLAASKRGKPVAGFLNDAVVRNALTVKGVRGRDGESVDEALRIIRSGRYPLDVVRTHRLPLAETDRALRILGERLDPSAIHVNVVP